MPSRVAECKRLSHSLERFLFAQSGKPRCTPYDVARRELEAGRKASHWIWYVFPQIRDESRSSAANDYFQIRNREEAVAYLQHPELGTRFFEMCSVVLRQLVGGAVDSVMTLMGGAIDAKKLHQSVTTFFLASEEWGNDALSRTLGELLDVLNSPSNRYALTQELLDPVVVAGYRSAKP